MNKKTYHIIAAMIFVLFLAVVFIGNLILPDKSFSPQENRILQQWPGVSLSKFMQGRLETKMENYANDQFMMRNGFIKVKSAYDTTLGTLESNGVIRARDHYLMEDISKPNKKYMQNTLQGLKKFKHKYKNLHMYFLLAPNAANILSDKLPRTFRTPDQNAYMDEFYQNIKADGIHPVDVRPALKKAAADPSKQIYYRTDHHWTTQGAYTAYEASKKKLKISDHTKYKSYVVKNDFYGTLYSKSGFTNGLCDQIRLYMPASKKDYIPSVMYYADSKTKTTHFYEMKNLKKKDAYTVFGGSNHPIYTIKTPVKSSRRLLLIKDSYANSFLPFLARNFREIVVVDPRYYFGNIDNTITTENITDVLFLYNANTVFTDSSLSMMLNS